MVLHLLELCWYSEYIIIIIQNIIVSILHPIMFIYYPLRKKYSIHNKMCTPINVKPEHFPEKVIRCIEWWKRQRNKPPMTSLTFTKRWTTLKCLNRLRKGDTCRKSKRKRWKFYIGDTTCGIPGETTSYVLN